MMYRCQLRPSAPSQSQYEPGQRTPARHKSTAGLAGSVSYKWAEVLSADAFSMSEEAGLKDETVVNRKSWRCLATDRAPAHAAGYFSYKWAEVLSADAFSAFEEVGLENKSAVKETGRRFRDTVLALGGGRAPADVFKVQCTPAHDACEASLAVPGNQFMETGRRFRDTVLALGSGRYPALVLRAIYMLLPILYTSQPALPVAMWALCLTHRLLYTSGRQ